MKLILDKKAITENIANFLRQAGYLNIYDRRTDKESYVRSLTRGNYPRLHLYIKDLADSWELNLHLDHKQASYEGQHMHNAEYDGDLVSGEINRLAQLAGVNPPKEAKGAQPLPSAYQPKVAAKPDIKTRYSGKPLVLGHGNLDDFLAPPRRLEKKPWWKFF